MNKKAQTEKYIVEFVILVVSALVLFGVWKVYESKVLEAATVPQCNLNILFSAGSKLLMAGLSEIPPECQAEYVTVDKGMIDRSKILAQQRIKTYAEDKTSFYTNAKNDFQQDSKSADEWALDYAVAKRLTTCADKVFHGNVDFFSRNANSDRNFCVVCSIMNFADDIPDTVKNRKINTLFSWSQAESLFGKTYYDYTAEGMTIKPDISLLGYFTGMPQAVVYTETKKSFTDKHWGKLLAAGAVASAATLNPIPLWAAAYNAALTNLKADVEVKEIMIIPYESLGSLQCTDLIR